MEKVDVTIIGAGVIGLSIAERLSSTRLVVLLIEKNERFGMETSSRNSEVIHSGIYYPAHSLKAELCLKGNTLLYKMCAKHNIPHAQIGKIVVATSQDEIEPLERLYERGRTNGVKGLEMLTAMQVCSLEPSVKAYGGLLVPTTGIVDTEKLMRFLFMSGEQHGIMSFFKKEVISIQRTGDYLFTICISPDNEMFETRWVINTTGLHADRVAAFAGVDIEREGYKLTLYKGEYYRLKRALYTFSHLVYPLPEGEGTSLGIHLSFNLNKQIRFGPNRYRVDTIDYSMDESHKRTFINALQAYLPDLQENDLIPDTCGIRPHIGDNSKSFKDFIIREERSKGLPGLINCIGIDSPGLTAAPAIADYVADMIL